MCDICEQTPCHPQCPNYKYHRAGTCKRCGKVLYEEYEIWVDDDENRFCSEGCAKDYYGIKEMDY